MHKMLNEPNVVFRYCVPKMFNESEIDVSRIFEFEKFDEKEIAFCS